MQKKLVLLGFVLWSVLSTLASALELDSAELRRALKSKDLEFINYQGPYDVINTIEQIRGIGRFLGSKITASSDSIDANYFGKYRVLRVLDTKASDKLSADLFLIEEDSEVDSITNIRRMLSGYLIKAFKYSFEDAKLLAKLITIYNAIYRGDMDNVNAQYIPAVVDQVSRENVGLARVYSQWAGKTRMLIPLRSSVGRGPASKVDVNALTTDQVIRTLIASELDPVEVVQKVSDQKDQVNREEQKHVTDMKDMLSMRQKKILDRQSVLIDELSDARLGKGTRSIEEIQNELNNLKLEQEDLFRQREKAQVAQDKLNQEERKTDTGRSRTQDLIKNAKTPVKEVKPITEKEREVKKDLEERRPTSEGSKASPSSKSKEKQGSDSNQRLGQQGMKSVPSTQQSTEVKNAKQQPNMESKANKQVENNQNKSVGKGAQNNEKRVVSRPGQVENPIFTPTEEDHVEVVAQVDNLVYFTRIIDGPKGVGQVLLVDSTDKKILAQSADLNIMRGSSFLFGDELVVVTLEKDGARLKSLDAKTLTEKSQALYLIHSRSAMNVNKEAIYLIVEKNNNWYLARFGKELTVEEVLSRDTVMPYTEIRFQDGVIYVESEDGEILALDPATLKRK